MLNCSLEDREFFAKVTDLLFEEYPDLKDKYGIWRVHEHFPLQAGQVFHETSDDKTQESTLRIIDRDDLPERAFVSAWQLDKAGPVAKTWCCDWSQ